MREVTELTEMEKKILRSPLGYLSPTRDHIPFDKAYPIVAHIIGYKENKYTK